MYTKIKKRHRALKELISTNNIEDQETLVSLMQKKHGVTTSQSIISRDLRALGINKHHINNKMVYEPQETDASREILRFAVIDIVHNESLIVIRTLPGIAPFVADFLDMHHDNGILGTIAGENTIFITPITIKKIRHVTKKLQTLLYIKTNKSKDIDE